MTDNELEKWKAGILAELRAAGSSPKRTDVIDRAAWALGDAGRIDVRCLDWLAAQWRAAFD